MYYIEIFGSYKFEFLIRGNDELVFLGLIRFYFNVKVFWFFYMLFLEEFWFVFLDGEFGGVLEVFDEILKLVVLLVIFVLVIVEIDGL